MTIRLAVLVFSTLLAGPAAAQWFNDGGYPHSEALKVTERFTRRDFGHMDIRITIDDPEAYTRPWTVTIPKELMPDTELIEWMCENEKDLPHLVGK